MAKTKDRLTKSGYLSFLRCPQEYWLRYHQPLFVIEPYSLEYEHRRQEGYAVQQLVKQLARFQTSSEWVIDFERAFQTAELYSRTDIVATDRATGVVDLYEIKAAGSVKEEHYDDVAFQRLTIERSGFPVGRCFVITLDATYVRRGEVDPEQLFVITDVTNEVEERMEVTVRQAHEAIAYLKTVPIPSLVDYCLANRLDCHFIKLHFPGLPDYTVFDIPFLKHDKRRELLARDIVAITDVPDDFPLSRNQRIQVEAAKTGQRIINGRQIASQIEKWEYPLHFLDYETFSYAIPQFEGVRPFQQMCFQYSLHTIRSPGGEPEHKYFLSHGLDDPPRAMAENLRNAMADGMGTVLVWYESFEKTRNTEMAEMFPDLAPFFEEVNERTRDLMKIFSDKLYIDPAFKGRSSIKKVLPVLVPALSYASLGIGDGLTASISWFRAAKWTTMDAETRQKIFSDLEIYCELDTLAMVEIFRVLTRVAADNGDLSVGDVDFAHSPNSVY